MPELPEVETVRRGLVQRALGRRVTRAEVCHPGAIAQPVADFVASVRGCTLDRVDRKGKVLSIGLRDSNGQAAGYLLVRLGMTGQLIVSPRSAPLRPHTHVRLILDGGAEEIRFRDPRRFGRLGCCTREELEAILDRLGPDAREIGEEQFLAAMRGRRGAIKSWLMNQQALAGLGNIYADESLFLARIHPLAQPGRVSRQAARRLYRAVRNVLKHAVELQGTSFRDYTDIEGSPGNFRLRLRVYQRTGQPCRRCGAKIRRIVISGRSSHFCPRCQPRSHWTAVMRGPKAVSATGEHTRGRRRRPSSGRT